MDSRICRGRNSCKVSLRFPNSCSLASEFRIFAKIGLGILKKYSQDFKAEKSLKFFKFTDMSEIATDTPIVYKNDVIFDCQEISSGVRGVDAGTDRVNCVLFESGNSLTSYSYSFDSSKNQMTFIQKQDYTRDYSCTPVKLRTTSNFITVECRESNSNTERIILYDQEYTFMIYRFEFQSQDTDFSMKSYSADNILLAVSGAEPKLYTINKNLYLDSSTRDLDSISDISIVFDYLQETSVKLSDMFEQGEKPKPEKQPVPWIWIILGGVLILMLLVFGVAVLRNKAKDKERIQTQYRSMDLEDESGERQRANTINDELRQSAIGSGRTKSNLSKRSFLFRSVFKKDDANKGYVDSDGVIKMNRGLDSGGEGDLDNLS